MSQQPSTTSNSNNKYQSPVFTRSISNDPKQTLKAKQFLASIEDTLLQNSIEIEFPAFSPQLSGETNSNNPTNPTNGENNEQKTKVKYPILSAQDLMDWPLVMAHQKCSLCYLHGMHTPCGNALNKWQKCTLESNILGEKSTKVLNLENDENGGGENGDDDQNLKFFVGTDDERDRLAHKEKELECQDIFNKEFFPCFAPIASSPYYHVRSSLLYTLPIPDLMDYWFRMQKLTMLDNVFKKTNEKSLFTAKNGK